MPKYSVALLHFCAQVRLNTVHVHRPDKCLALSNYIITLTDTHAPQSLLPVGALCTFVHVP